MSASQLVLLVILLALVAGIIVLFHPGNRNRTPPDSAPRDDDRYWTLGFLYNNPDDPDVFVPKRFVPGRTINIGHPLGKLIMICILALLVTLGILSSTGALPAYGCHPSGCTGLP